MKSINWKKIIKSICVLFLFFNLSLLLYIPVILFKIDSSLFGDVRLNVLLSAFASLVLTFILIIIYRKDLFSEFKNFKDKWSENMKIGVDAWAIGVIIMASSNLILEFIFNSGGANNENAVQEMIMAYPLVMGLYTCIIAPFNEEIVFRKTLYDVFKNKWVFVFISFLLFGLAHVYSSATTLTDWLYIIPYGALGGAFAYAYNKTDTVFTSMSLHIIHNSVLFLISLLTFLH